MMNYKQYDLVFDATGTYRIMQVDDLTGTVTLVKQIWNPFKEHYEPETTKGTVIYKEKLIKFATPNSFSDAKEKERGKLKFQKRSMK